MKLVVGLGNPGPRYAESRHNVGFRVVEALARELGLELAEERFLGLWAEGVLPRVEGRSGAQGGDPVGLLLPQTFMNGSGASVARAVAACPTCRPEVDLVVVYDDLDLPLGRLRLRPAGGAGGHRGMASVIEALGTREIPRLRFGIGRPAAGGGDGRAQVVDFVLDGFSASERVGLEELVSRAALAARVLLRDGAVEAMDRFNADPDSAPSGA